MRKNDCGCRVHGNQYGHYLKLCDTHSLLVETKAREMGVSAQEFVNMALRTYLERQGVD